LSRSGVRMDVPFFQVPNAVFRLGLKVSELAVYTYLCKCGNQGGTAFPSYNDIAAKCSISRSTAMRAVKSLEAKEIIVKQKRYSGNREEYFSNVYVVQHSFEASESLPEDLVFDSFHSAGATELPTEEVRQETREAIEEGQKVIDARERWSR